MESTVDAEGRWSVPTHVSLRGKPTPDGKYFVFNQRGDLYAQPLSGTAPRLIASRSQLGGPVQNITTSSDPSVVFVRLIDSAAVHSFYSVPVSGGVPRLVARMANTAHRPARLMFATDAHNLFFTLTQAESDIWVVALHR